MLDYGRMVMLADAELELERVTILVLSIIMYHPDSWRK